MLRQKRILLLCLNFAPELISTGRYTSQLAFYLSEHGNAVHVIAAPPYYPQWKIQPSYSSWRYAREGMRAIQIFRCPLWVPAVPSNLKRILHLLSFGLSCLPVALWQSFWKPDLVLCIVPTLFSAPAALLAARLAGAKTWLHIQDFELDAAVNLQMLPGAAWLNRLGAIFERVVVGGFDHVSTLSDGMADVAKHKGVTTARILRFPNWVDIKAIHPLQGKNSLRIELGIPLTKTIVLYHGAMGRKQGLEILIKTAAQMGEKSEVLFLLSGEGPAKQALVLMARGLANVRFCALQPPEKLNLLVNLADIHVLPQLADAADLVMPSKLATMLASGKPVIATAHGDTDIGRVVKQVGVLVPPEDRCALAEAIVTLSRSPALRSHLGQKGRNYAVRNWNAHKVLKIFQQNLEQAATA